MPLGIRRLAACLAAVFAMLLAGCDVSGHIELRSRDQVVVDLVVTQDSDDAGCALGALNMGGRLTVVQRLDVNGVRTCHVQGTVHPEQLRPYLHVSHVGEYVTVSFNPFSRAPDSSRTGSSGSASWTSRCRLPGRCWPPPAKRTAPGPASATPSS